MEHIRITVINENIVKLLPDNGYVLVDTTTGRRHSVAFVTSDKTSKFIAEVVGND